MNNTADKLAQIARVSQQKTKECTCRECGGIGLPSKAFMNYHNIQAKKGEVEFETKFQDCLKCQNCGHSWTNSKGYDEERKKISWASHQYVRNVKKLCTKLAEKGFGSVEIKLDQTTDLWGKIERENSCYSADFVITLLKKEGFSFNDSETVDHYDALDSVLVWDAQLQKAPSSEKIGMAF